VSVVIFPSCSPYYIKLALPPLLPSIRLLFPLLSLIASSLSCLLFFLIFQPQTPTPYLVPLFHAKRKTELRHEIAVYLCPISVTFPFPFSL